MKKRSIITAAGVVLVVAVVAWQLIVPAFASKDTLAEVRTFSLEKTTLTDSVSVTGTVESTDAKNVYSTLTYQIKEVNVEVGDKVQQGQVLCSLDTESLELDIAQQKANLDNTQKNSLVQLESSQRTYNEALANISNGTNSQLVSAESSLKTASLDLENKKKLYNEKQEQYDNGTNSQLINAQTSLNSAKLDLEDKTKSYNDNKTLYQNGIISESDYNRVSMAYEASLNTFNSAQATLDALKITLKQELDQSKTALDAAQNSYDNARAAYNTAQVSTSQEVEKHKSNLESTIISANTDAQVIAIQKLEKQLKDSVITAPISGTVTAVYAKEGASGSGLLFVIEDTDDLKIKTQIKEYDAGFVQPGMMVTIKSDSTGDQVFDGELTKIAPTAMKNSSGQSISSTDVQFEAEVTVKSADTGLKIGMNTRMNIILQEKSDIFSVPFDAITTNSKGQDVIYVLETSENQNSLKEVPVTTGMETDFYVEVSGEGLAEGLHVASNASSANGQGSGGEQAGGFRMMMGN